MESLIHLMQHITGACGEPHPSLLWGGLLCILKYILSLLNLTNKRGRQNV